MAGDVFTQSLPRHVWQSRYRFEAEPDVASTWHRVAGALAEVEPHHRRYWTRRNPAHRSVS